MTPEQLKASILQIAIQGKLVEQKEEEGTAEELYQQIQEEKKKLIKEGKIKKGKPLADITEDEIPFDIPESWKWVKLPYVATSSLGKTLNKGTDNGIEVPYLCSINVYWEGISLEKVKRAKFSDKDIEKYRLQKGDLLVCEGGDVGRSAIWDRDEEMYFQNALHCIRFYGNISTAFIKYCFEYYKANRTLEEASKGMTIKHLVQSSLYSLVFPLPPLEEQHRIVAKIEELLPLVDRYAASYEKLEKINAKFPEDMKKSILQYAIQGKLVDQREEEGTAEELYQQIQEEKKKLIKEGKIKKGKKLADITEDEIPFDIPESWKWVKLGYVISLLSGSDFSPNKYNSNREGIPYMTGASNIKNDKLSINRWTLVPNNISEINDLLLVCKGSGYGKTVKNNVGRIHIARQFMAFKCGLSLDYEYLNYYLQSQIITIKKNGQGVIPGIDRGFVLNMPFPLPPLGEQHRIVAKIEEFLPYCDQLVK